MGGDNLEGTANLILQMIKLNPGCHLRMIKEGVDISMGTTQYHLDKLEKMGRITSTRSGLHKHYFPIGVFGENEKEILQVLGQETTREIIMTVIEKQSPTQTDIVKRVGISGPSVSWHLKRLMAIKLLEEIKDGKHKRYKVFDITTSKYITTLMRNYYPTVWNKWSNRLIEIFLSLSNEEHKLESQEDDDT